MPTDDLGLHTIGDDVPGLGPAGGLVTALRHRARGRGEGWIVVSACDWAGVEAEWIPLLWGGVATGVKAVLFDPGQPLFGLYHTGAEPALAAAIDAGRLRMQDIALGAVTGGGECPGRLRRGRQCEPARRPGRLMRGYCSTGGG